MQKRVSIYFKDFLKIPGSFTPVELIKIIVHFQMEFHYPCFSGSVVLPQESYNKYRHSGMTIHSAHLSASDIISVPLIRISCVDYLSSAISMNSPQTYKI